MNFYYLVDDRRVGPFNETELLRLYESHILPGETPIILDGETEWSTIGTKFSAKDEPPPSQNTTPESQPTTPPLFNPEAVAALKAYATRIGNGAKRMAINFAIFMAAETKAINQARRKSISDYKTQNTAIFNQKTLAVKAFWHNLTWRQKSLIASALLALTYVAYAAASAITSTIELTEKEVRYSTQQQLQRELLQLDEPQLLVKGFRMMSRSGPICEQLLDNMSIIADNNSPENIRMLQIERMLPMLERTGCIGP